jgi:hypothetical protein
MKSVSRRRLALGAALVVALTPVCFAPADGDEAAVQTQTFDGKVVPLAAVLEKFGSRLDRDAAPYWLALGTADGKTYPLIKDDGARMFFVDARLLNRPMRLTGRLFADTNLLQVVKVNSYLQGELQDLYYWCDICAIRRNEKKICECCGGPMELREEPLQK